VFGTDVFEAFPAERRLNVSLVPLAVEVDGALRALSRAHESLQELKEFLLAHGYSPAGKNWKRRGVLCRFSIHGATRMNIASDSGGL